MKLIQGEIEAGANSVMLAWTLRWLLLPDALEAILADPEKQMASMKITVMNTKGKDTFIRSSIRFDGKRH